MKRKNLILTTLLALSCHSLLAIEQPDLTGAGRLVFQSPELAVSELNTSASTLASAAEKARVQRLGAAVERAHFDLRTGRFATLTPAVPLLPGTGFGNHLSWNSFAAGAPQTRGELQQVAWTTLRAWLVANADNLRLDPAELPDSARVTVIDNDYLQFYVPRRVAGYAVRNSHLTATIKFGNLMMVSLFQWGDVDKVITARLTEQQAAATLQQFVGNGFAVSQTWKSSQLMWIPVSDITSLSEDQMGSGLSYRLAWVLRTTFGEAGAHFEAIVDAVNGEVLAIEDLHQHVATTRSVDGGAYPVSNDGASPDGIEQADSPMSFSFVTTPGGTLTTDVGGNLPVCVDGSISSSLTGQYVAINDNCGAPSLAGTGDLDWGVSTGTDCTTPGFGGAGNTHASRTGFFELNQLKAMARGQLPNNNWLQQQITSNMNINSTCNAFWNGATVNFYRSGGGCFNTGELAGVFDHEWGHGMDNNDAVPTISSPGEGIADIYASLRLDDSCLGRHFRATNCGGYGNACTSCTGVRDIDWAKHTANTPFTMTNADACGTGGPAPCGGSVHCEGQIYSQAVWDLWNRDLTGAPFNLAKDVTREIATQLTYRGASGVQAWFACTGGTGGCSNAAGCGCAGTAGYQQYLIADDDNGNLNDGTPHMQALFNAFSRHGIACTTPTVTTAGCAGTPTEVPVVTATPIDRGVSLSWTASTGATGYRVYRTDGVFNCSFGKELLATVAGTTYADLGLKNGRNYYYQVVPMGSQDECFSVASSCTTGTPASGANVGFAPATISLLTGDADPFLDNCESARITIPVSNTGTGTQTNVRITSIVSPSHPLTTILTGLPLGISASLAACGAANATFDFVPQGLAAGDTITFTVGVISDQMAIPRFANVSFSGVEGDLQNFASKTFTFEADTENWQTQEGTFVRSNTGGGANSTAFYFKSSEFLDDQCDVIRSPALRLSASSTMTLQNQYNIEPFSGGQWWDRANVGIRPIGSATRTLVTPNTGRLYNATGTGGTCGTDLQGGWAAANTTWGASGWDATALQSSTFAGQLVQLEVRYGTDSGGNDFGFHFDEVTVTNVDVEVADAQTNTCSALPPFFADGFETGNTSAWSITTP